jgi:hypothetical protein
VCASLKMSLKMLLKMSWKTVTAKTNAKAWTLICVLWSSRDWMGIVETSFGIIRIGIFQDFLTNNSYIQLQP